MAATAAILRRTDPEPDYPAVSVGPFVSFEFFVFFVVAFFRETTR